MSRRSNRISVINEHKLIKKYILYHSFMAFQAQYFPIMQSIRCPLDSHVHCFREMYSIVFELGFFLVFHNQLDFLVVLFLKIFLL